MARYSQQKGDVGETIAEMALRLKGVRMVERIATPVAITARGKAGWVKIAHTTPVSGDRRGVMPDGRRVLAEVKSRDERLIWSDFEDHQVDALDENHRCHAVSLIVWVHSYGYVVMRWPIPGFGPGKGLHWKQAEMYEWDGET